jgi:hypothetical protein
MIGFGDRILAGFISCRGRGRDTNPLSIIRRTTETLLPIKAEKWKQDTPKASVCPAIQQFISLDIRLTKSSRMILNSFSWPRRCEGLEVRNNLPSYTAFQTYRLNSGKIRILMKVVPWLRLHSHMVIKITFRLLFEGHIKRIRDYSQYSAIESFLDLTTVVSVDLSCIGKRWPQGSGH